MLYYLLSVVTGFGVAWWSYSGQKVDGNLRYVLLALRGTVFSMLLVLLFDPSYSWYGEQLNRKKVILAVDNSASIAVQKGKYEGAATARRVAERLHSKLEPLTQLKTVLFDASVTESASSSATFEGGQTDLANLLETVSQDYDVASLVLLTDGISTVGKDPAYLTGTLGFPVFAVALGDTGKVDDVWIDEVEAPSDVFVNTEFSTTVYVGWNGFGGSSITVTLKSGKRELSRKTVTIQPNQPRVPVRLTARTADKGLQTYTVAIEPQAHEFTHSNNLRTFAVDVRNSRTRILHVAYDIHPDVKVVREILSKDATFRVYPLHITASGKLFGPEKIPTVADTFEVVVLHGIPTVQQLAVFNPFSGIWKERPFVLLAGPASRFENAQQQEWFPLTYQGFPDWRPVQLSRLRSTNARHPVVSNLDGDVTRFPPLLGMVRKADFKSGSMPLFNASHLGVDSDAPALVVRQHGFRRSALLTAYGFNQWYVSTDAVSRTFATTLFSNLIQWAAADPGGSKSVIRPIKPVFTPREDVLFEADIRNDSGAPEDNAGITLQLAESDLGTFTFKKDRAGVYTLNTGKLKPGAYSYRAKVSIQGTTEETITGQFDVAEQNVETANLIRNQAFLRNLTAKTGGALYEAAEVDALLEAMESRKLLEPSKVWVERQLLFRTTWWWFAIIVALLALEWLLRKRVALP